MNNADATAPLDQPFEQTFATLCIYGDDLVHKELTQSLRCAPTTCLTKGDFIRRSVYAARSVWELSSRGSVKSSKSSDHILWLFEASGIAHDAVRELRQRGYDVRLYLSWAFRQRSAGPVIAPNALRYLADLDIELRIGAEEASHAA